MDDEELRRATRRWVTEDLIDQSTADAIVAYERDRPVDNTSTERITTIVAVMGALLVGVGLLAAIAAAWDALDDVTRTILLVAGPVLTAAGGIELDRREYGRTGIGLWILAAVLVGPCLFLLADMHRPGVDASWLLLLWGLMALPMGHAFRTRIGTIVGIGTLLGAVVLAGAQQSGLLAAGMLGAVVATAAIPLRPSAPALVETYRTMALVPVLAALLWITVVAGVFNDLDLGLTPILGGAFVLAVIATGLAMRWQGADRATTDEVSLVAIPLAGSVFGLGVGLVAQLLPALAVALLVHGVIVLTLLAIVAVGIRLGSAWLVNLVAIGFLLQVLSLLALLIDDLSGALALIVAGIVLLTASIALERGRRRLLARLNRPK